MTEFFKPYEGKKPYLFVSYSHRNSAEVIDVIRILHERRYRLWYDEGIPAGSDWPRNIAVHMRDCRTVLFFLSRTALASPNCLSEITTAKKQGKTILLMKLEDVDIQKADEKWRACLRDAVEISAEGGAAERAERILVCPQVTEEFLGTEEDFREDGNGRGSGSAAIKAAIILASVVLLLAIGNAVKGGETEFEIAASGQHDIGGPLWHPEGKKLYFHVTNAGQRVGSMCLPGTEIMVEESASADVGWLNAGGIITVRGDAGDTAGHCSSGGKIYIGGRAGTRSGSLMKHDPLYEEPELWVLKNVGSFSFEFMGGGRAVVFPTATVGVSFNLGEIF